MIIKEEIMKKEKEQLVLTKAIADLTAKGYNVFTSVTPDAKFDFIAYNHNDEEYYRIKIQYSTEGYIKSSNDFDYHALYLSEIDKLVYPSTDFNNVYIVYDKNRCGNDDFDHDVYWYEDFLDLTNIEDVKVRNKEQILQLSRGDATNLLYNLNMVSPDTLTSQVCSIGYAGTGRMYGVSDNTIRYRLKKAAQNKEK
jgi:hypothetical protein